MTKKVCPKCKLDPTRGEATADLLSGVMSALAAGELPEKRDSVRDAVIWVLMRMLEEYFSRGGSNLSRELDHLLAALGNKQDPIVQDLGLEEQSALWAMLNTVRQTKEMNRGEGQQAEARPGEERKEA